MIINPGTGTWNIHNNPFSADGSINTVDVLDFQSYMISLLSGCCVTYAAFPVAWLYLTRKALIPSIFFFICSIRPDGHDMIGRLRIYNEVIIYPRWIIIVCACIIRKVGIKTSFSVSKPDLVTVVTLLEIIYDPFTCWGPYRVIALMRSTACDLFNFLCKQINHAYFNCSKPSPAI